jgi:hypothetical protein
MNILTYSLRQTASAARAMRVDAEANNAIVTSCISANFGRGFLVVELARSSENAWNTDKEQAFKIWGRFPICSPPGFKPHFPGFHDPWSRALTLTARLNFHAIRRHEMFNVVCEQLQDEMKCDLHKGMCEYRCIY